MARQPRIHAPGAMYHVTLRGNHQQDIFFTPGDRQRLDELIAAGLVRFGARLHAYCYMTNHIHALIQVGDVPLGQMMMRVASQYARMTQARLETTGHLFERRYHCVLVDADSYFTELLRYIHLNPVTAGLARTPDVYPWSSHHAYAGVRKEDWLTTDFGLSLFSGDQLSAIDAYQRFVHDSLQSAGSRSPLENINPSDCRILGSDDFARRLLGTEWKPRSRKTLEDLIAEASGHFNVDAEAMRSPARTAQLVAARVWIAEQAQSGRIASVAAVARRLNRDESSLRRAMESHRVRSRVLPECRPGTV